MSKKTLTVDGVTLAYEDKGQGRPVVFIHGFPTSTFTWSRIAGPLSDLCRCISFDLMGFGDSDKPLDESYSIHRQAELIRKAIEQLGLERPVIAGHSMGGAICLHILKDLGELHTEIGGIILANSACYPQPMPWFFVALKIPALPGMVLRKIPPKLAYLMVKDTAYHPASRMKLDDILGYVLNVRKPGAAEAFVATAKEIVPPDIDEMVNFYPKIRIPALMIWGKQDWVIPLRYGERLVDEIPNATLCLVDNCRHTPQEERPEEVVTAIKEFMGDLENKQQRSM